MNLSELKMLYEATRTRPQGGNADELDFGIAITAAFPALVELLEDAREALKRSIEPSFWQPSDYGGIRGLLARFEEAQP